MSTGAFNWMIVLTPFLFTASKYGCSDRIGLREVRRLAGDRQPAFMVREVMRLAQRDQVIEVVLPTVGAQAVTPPSIYQSTNSFLRSSGQVPSMTIVSPMCA